MKPFTLADAKALYATCDRTGGHTPKSLNRFGETFLMEQPRWSTKFHAQHGITAFVPPRNCWNATGSL